MARKVEPDFADLLQRFFSEWLVSLRNVSNCTVASYSDAFRLLVRWLDQERSIKPGSIGFGDIEATSIMAFALWLEERRRNSAKTVNCRINAMKSFAEFVSYEEPSLIKWAQSVRSLPLKRTKKPLLDYLTSVEVSWIVDECDMSSRAGIRDAVIIRTLFNTGARVSELAGLRVSSLDFGDGRQSIELFGKGRKMRRVPVWHETADALSAYIEDEGLAADGWLFPGRNVEHITRSGVRSAIDRHVAKARAKHPSLQNRAITAHTFRHSTAMAMLESGVNLSTIAIWLGHESIETTHKYMVASMALKEAALNKMSPPDSPQNRYRADPTLIEFLKTIAK